MYNRNQGNIARSQINVEQTQNELAALERRVLDEVASGRSANTT